MPGHPDGGGHPQESRVPDPRCRSEYNSYGNDLPTKYLEQECLQKWDPNRCGSMPWPEDTFTVPVVACSIATMAVREAKAATQGDDGVFAPAT